VHHVALHYCKSKPKVQDAASAKILARLFQVTGMRRKNFCLA
jgi:hypothetical protein